MQSRGTRIALAVAALVVVVVLFVVLQEDDDDDNASSPAATSTTQTTNATTTDKPTATTGTPPIPQIVVRNGAPVGGVRKLRYSKGDRVRFRVRSDVADEVHVHGYDIKRDVPAGGQVRFTFPATIEGVFEIELEARATEIASLVVEP